MEPCREREDQTQFHQLRWLDLLAAKLQPTLGAFADMANLQNENQQGNTCDIGEPGKPGKKSNIDQLDTLHQQQPEREPNDMTRGIRLPRTPRATLQGVMPNRRQRAKQ